MLFETTIFSIFTPKMYQNNSTIESIRKSTDTILLTENASSSIYFGIYVGIGTAAST